MDCVKVRFGREEDLSDIDLWTPKIFTCSFCKREFRSAQALGGHMNVHRRDRARLRLLPLNSILSSSSNPNPNPNNPSSYFSLSSSSSSSSSLLGANKFFLEHENKKMVMFKGGSHQHHPSKGVKRSVLDCKLQVVKKDEKERDMIRGDVYMGLVIKDPNYKEEVDLELRLGYL